MAARNDNSGLLLALLKERHPNWYRLAPRVLEARLTELAEAVYGDTASVSGIMDGIGRLQAYELEQVEIEARRQAYTAALATAKSAAASYLSSEKEQITLKARHVEDMARIERSRSGNAATVARFLREYPEETLLAEWPRLDSAKRPEHLAATAKAMAAGTPEHLRLKRHEAELEAAMGLRATWEAK